MTGKTMKTIGAILLALGLVACGLEEPIFSAATDKGPDWVPAAPKPYSVLGQVYGLPGANIHYFTATGMQLDSFAAQADDEGVFSSQFPGMTEYRNLVVKAAASPGSTVILGLAARVPRNKDIYIDKVSNYHLGGMLRQTWGSASTSAGMPVMANLDERTTAITLALLEAARNQGASLANMSMASVGAAVATLADEYYKAGSPMKEFGRQVARLTAASSAERFAPQVFLFPRGDSWLNPDFLDQVAVDYSGDGFADRDTGAFDQVAAEAASLVTLSACETSGTVKMVFMVDMGEGTRDRNCNSINRFKVAKDESGKSMFITGAMEVNIPTASTPVCENGVTEHCLSKDQWAQVNDMLGNWKPNVVPMRDDGQEGDSVAGDGIWTLVLEMPYIDPEESPLGKGVRVGYKYTWGYPGDNWGGTEEWAGNNRIFELNDINGDGMVVRFDSFGDETSNKNVANLYKGSCGGIAPWPESTPGGCIPDVTENRVDSNGDCIPDTFPTAETVTPSCGAEGDISVGSLDGKYSAGDPEVRVDSVDPAVGLNGGGFLVTLKGADFFPALTVEVNSPDGTYASPVAGYFVPDPKRLLFLAPGFVSGGAEVALTYDKMEGDAAKPVTVKKTLQYNETGILPCLLVSPAEAQAPGQGTPAGQELDRVLIRLLLGGDVSALFPGDGLLVEAGVGPVCCSGSDEGHGPCPGNLPSCFSVPDPRVAADSWMFFPAAADPSCSVPPGSGLEDCEANQVQFRASVEVGEAGRHRVVARYSRDYGRSWDYCSLPDDEGKGSGAWFDLRNSALIWSE